MEGTPKADLFIIRHEKGRMTLVFKRTSPAHMNLYGTQTFTLYKPMDPEICKSLNLAHLLPKYSTSNLKHDRL